MLDGCRSAAAFCGACFGIRRNVSRQRSCTQRFRSRQYEPAGGVLEVERV